VGTVNPWAFQLVALGTVGSSSSFITAYFGGAVLLSSTSYINFQNVNSYILGYTSNTSLAASSDVYYAGSSSSGMHMEVAGTLTNTGTWKGNVYVGSGLVNEGTIQGDVQTTSGAQTLGGRSKEV
jgi:hypothetical protein